MKKEKTFQFTIETFSKSLGIVTAISKEEAIKKIKDGDYDDIYDEVDSHYGKILDINESK